MTATVTLVPRQPSELAGELEVKHADGLALDVLVDGHLEVTGTGGRVVAVHAAGEWRHATVTAAPAQEA